MNKPLGPFGGNPPEVFPVNSTKALRGAFYTLEKDEETFLTYSKAVFHTYWELGQDISQNDILLSIIRKIPKIHPDEFMSYIEKNEIKLRLRDNTQACMDCGGFGSPTILVNKKFMYFGNDRIPLLQRRILMESTGKLVTGFPSWKSNL